ncbi:beta/gamma crystallin domain-containing protein [Streptomyces sp. NPDC059454]|uniref:beta/gamma crystallin domain-containing protein n=1 Tax=Streptomyces sp. NPDC059454 TaxID=3346836 RepID=UPI00369A37D7
MLSRKLRLALPVAAAAVMAVVMPAGTAHAIDKVNCGPSDYLRADVHGQDYIGSFNLSFCFANKGTYNFAASGPGTAVWVDKISTGNNRVKYHDVNGTTVTYPKHYIITFPNRPPHVDWIEIL